MMVARMPIVPRMHASDMDPLQRRVQALFERVLAEVDAADPSDARMLMLRLRLMGLTHRRLSQGIATNASPQSDVVVIH